MKSTTASIDFAVCVLHGNEDGGCQRGHGAIRASWAAFLQVMKWRQAELWRQVPADFFGPRRSQTAPAGPDDPSRETALG